MTPSARPLSAPSGWVTTDDYPARDIRERREGVTRFSPGDRAAYASGPMGAYAEFHAVPAARAVQVVQQAGQFSRLGNDPEPSFTIKIESDDSAGC